MPDDDEDEEDEGDDARDEEEDREDDGEENGDDEEDDAGMGGPKEQPLATALRGRIRPRREGSCGSPLLRRCCPMCPFCRGSCGTLFSFRGPEQKAVTDFHNNACRPMNGRDLI